MAWGIVKAGADRDRSVPATVQVFPWQKILPEQNEPQQASARGLFRKRGLYKPQISQICKVDGKEFEAYIKGLICDAASDLY